MLDGLPSLSASAMTAIGLFMVVMGLRGILH